MKGRIVKGIAGQYTVRTPEDQRYICAARGRFRADGTVPLVGDRVLFEPGSGRNAIGLIREIEPRDNALIRPPVANLTQIVLVAAVLPEIDYLLLDRMAAYAVSIRVRVALCLNKCDLDHSGQSSAFASAYRATGFPVLPLSAETGLNIHSLRDVLKGQISCFAGQSGVGKSSIINALYPQFALKTGEVSRKIARGRHTTRTIELIATQDGMIFDTPGFSMLDAQEVCPEELPLCYPDFAAHADLCRFRGCLHDLEPGCAVKEAVDAGKIDAARHERYRALLGETREKWKNRFDK